MYCKHIVFHFKPSMWLLSVQSSTQLHLNTITNMFWAWLQGQFRIFKIFSPLLNLTKKTWSELNLNLRLLGWRTSTLPIELHVSSPIDLFITVQPSLISSIDINVTKPRLVEQNSLVPNCKMIISIHYCCSIRGTWPRWRQHDKGLLLAVLSPYFVKSLFLCAILDLGSSSICLQLSNNTKRETDWVNL